MTDKGLPKRSRDDVDAGIVHYDGRLKVKCETSRINRAGE